MLAGNDRGERSRGVSWLPHLLPRKTAPSSHAPPAPSPQASPILASTQSPGSFLLSMWGSTCLRGRVPGFPHLKAHGLKSCGSLSPWGGKQEALGLYGAMLESISLTEPRILCLWKPVHTAPGEGGSTQAPTERGCLLGAVGSPGRLP